MNLRGCGGMALNYSHSFFPLRIANPEQPLGPGHDLVQYVELLTQGWIQFQGVWKDDPYGVLHAICAPQSLCCQTFMILFCRAKCRGCCVLTCRYVFWVSSRKAPDRLQWAGALCWRGAAVPGGWFSWHRCGPNCLWLCAPLWFAASRTCLSSPALPIWALLRRRRSLHWSERTRSRLQLECLHASGESSLPDSLTGWLSSCGWSYRWCPPSLILPPLDP